MADFSGYRKSIQDILSMMTKPPEIWALFDYPPASTYTKGRVCLLGDAAHGTTPHQGAGAGMAIEDALYLSTLLGMVGSGTGREISAAFSVYDQYQRPRTQKLVRTSRDAGLLYEMQLAGVGEDVEKIKDNLFQRMKWIWEENFENLDVAKDTLRGRLLKNE